MILRRNKPFIIISLGAFALSSLLFFTSLDNRLFDLFLHFLPSLTEHENVIVMTVDDNALNLAGGFPFKREIMADIVVLLKEFGVESIVFDLSYLDESAPRFDPAYAARRFEELFREDIHLLQNAAGNELEENLALLGRDVDEYFAGALAFSANAWLTLTMIPPHSLLDSEEFITDKETDRYLAENTALKNVIAMDDSKTPEMAAVMTNIDKLFRRAKGSGYVNASPDPDGIRRRVHLLLKYQGEYYGQLTLAAIQEKLGYPSIEVSNRTITLKNKDGGTLRIPRTQDGSVLYKWPKKSFYDYRMMPLAELIMHIYIEKAFAANLETMFYDGFFQYWSENLSPWEYYSIAEDIKNNAFAENSAADDVWLTARQNFFSSSDAFLNGPYEDNILADVGGDPHTAAYVQEFFDVTRSQFNRMADIREKANLLKDSFCIIGSDATAMIDVGLTAFQENYPNVGSYAVVANMLLANEFLRDTPWYISAIIALFYALLIGFLLSRYDNHVSVIVGITGILVISVSFAIIFMIYKIYIGLAVPLVASALTFITIMVTKVLSTNREKAFLHNAFSRYLAPQIINEIISDHSKLNLGGEKREMTAVFTDLQGFSTISEQLDPSHLVRLLNRYLTVMSNIIMENEGTVDKYEGDAIIAFWGAPLPSTRHASQACRSALAIKRAEMELNKEFTKEGISPLPLFNRIGINTGDMVVGNMGAENKMDYTVMGNAVNLAARLESANKQYNTGGILISEYTHNATGEDFICRRLDQVRVIGINTPLRIYELLCLADEMDDEKREWLGKWEKAIDHLENWHFSAAAALFTELQKQCPDDKVAELYAWRSRSYIDDPPPPDWDGVSNLTEK